MAHLQPAEKQRKNNGPLKICFLTYRGNPTCGGQGIYTKRICRALRDLGHDVSVVSGPPYPELDQNIPLFKLPSLDLYNPENLFRVPQFHEFLSPINTLEWLDFSTGGFPEPLTFSLRAYNFFRSNSNHFDIIHDNQCLSYGLLGIKRLGYPLVATIHHPITVDRNTEIKTAKYPWSKLKVMRWYSFIGMQKRVSKKLSHIITVSDCSKRDLAKEFMISPKKFRVTPNGIDTDVFYPLPQIKRHENRLIVTTSADTPLKGLAYLLTAVASIAKKRDIKLTVIGKPKRGSGVLNLIKKLELKNHLEFTDRIDDKDFAYYYALSSIAVVPSVYEGFGFPAGEAMACRIPVISTTGGALAEVVGDAGILVPPADAGALERAILDLLDNPDKREKLAEAGYKRVQEHFTWKKAAEKVVDVYREAIDANGRS
jgi:glycosyltransferase involved in cell wall biosynthesis